MSREIRRVPADWEHPKAVRGGLQPLYDKDFDTAARKWWDEAVRWHEAGADLKDYERDALPDHPWFWQWDGNPPDEDYYRPTWTEDPTHYQMYETVTEGTPVSPVFATLAELENWLVEDGVWPPGSRYSQKCSRENAKAFCEQGWSMSLVIDGKGVRTGLEACADLAGRKAEKS